MTSKLDGWPPDSLHTHVHIQKEALWEPHLDCLTMPTFTFLEENLWVTADHHHLIIKQLQPQFWVGPTYLTQTLYHRVTPELTVFTPFCCFSVGDQAQGFTDARCLNTTELCAWPSAKLLLKLALRIRRRMWSSIMFALNQLLGGYCVRWLLSPCCMQVSTAGIQCGLEANTPFSKLYFCAVKWKTLILKHKM